MKKVLGMDKKIVLTLSIIVMSLLVGFYVLSASPPGEVNPAAGNVGGTGAATTTYTAPLVGSDTAYTCTLIITDNQESIDSDSVSVLVKSSQPPDQPEFVATDLDYCAWGTYPLAAPGTSVTFSWTPFSDLDGDLMGAYEIEVDEDSVFTDPKFNHLVSTESTSYVLDLYHDDEEPDDLPPSMTDYQLDWASTYYWRVRVQDDTGAWSIWSDAFQFTTHDHAYPNPGFNWFPEEPSQGEIVVFTAVQEGAGYEYLWSAIPVGETTIENPTERITNMTFSADQSTVNLKVTESGDPTCWCDKDQDIEPSMPLPEYKEVSPFTWLKKMFAMMIDFFNGGF